MSAYFKQRMGSMLNENIGSSCWYFKTVYGNMSSHLVLWHMSKELRPALFNTMLYSHYTLSSQWWRRVVANHRCFRSINLTAGSILACTLE